MAFGVLKDDTWVERLKLKIGATVGLATFLSASQVEKYKRTFIEDYPKRVTSYTAAALLFCGLQEGIRNLRSGKSDALNSLAAGAVTGAIVVGHFQGPKYRFLGATLWGSIAAGLHLTNQMFRPRYVMEDFLIENNLLSPKVLELRPVSVRNAKRVMKTLEETTLVELMDEVERIRFRELASLNRVKTEVFDDQNLISLNHSRYFALPKSTQVQAASDAAELADKWDWRSALAAAEEPGNVEIATYEDVEDDEDFKSWLESREFNPERV